MKPDTSEITDRGESPSMMEPILISEGSRHRGALTDLAVEVAARAAGFRRSLPEGVRSALGDLVRSMNCYYSNLIEGHDTHPVDIERALRNDYAADRGQGSHRRSEVDRRWRTEWPCRHLGVHPRDSPSILRAVAG